MFQIINNKENSKSEIKILDSRTANKPSIIIPQEQVNSYYKNNINEDDYKLSNKVGIGIICNNSYQKTVSLVKSIQKKFSLKRTVMFILDVSGPKVQKKNEELFNSLDCVYLRIEPKTDKVMCYNILLTCLERFEYKIVLENSIEVLESQYTSFVESDKEISFYPDLYLIMSNSFLNQRGSFKTHKKFQKQLKHIISKSILSLISDLNE